MFSMLSMLMLHSASYTHMAALVQAESSGSGSVSEGQGSKQQPQERRPQEPVGQVQHNQAAVKHKLLERLADDVSCCVLCPGHKLN